MKDTMDTYNIFQVLVGIIVAMIAWFGTQLWGTVRELEREHARLREESARIRGELLASLGRIEERLTNEEKKI